MPQKVDVMLTLAVGNIERQKLLACHHLLIALPVCKSNHWAQEWPHYKLSCLRRVVVQEKCKDLIGDKNGRLPYLQLLAPDCSKYLHPELMEVVNPSCGTVALESESTPPSTDANEAKVNVYKAVFSEN